MNEPDPRAVLALLAELIAKQNGRIVKDLKNEKRETA